MQHTTTSGTEAQSNALAACWPGLGMVSHVNSACEQAHQTQLMEMVSSPDLVHPIQKLSLVLPVGEACDAVAPVDVTFDSKP